MVQHTTFEATTSYITLASDFKEWPKIVRSSGSATVFMVAAAAAETPHGQAWALGKL
jgi:hypothetical protein